MLIGTFFNLTTTNEKAERIQKTAPKGIPIDILIGSANSTTDTQSIDKIPTIE